MTMMRILMYFGVYLVIGIVIASIWRSTSCYSTLKWKYVLLKPDLFEIFNEVMFWPFLLIFLISIFSDSLGGLLCEIGNCIRRSQKRRRKKYETRTEPKNS